MSRLLDRLANDDYDGNKGFRQAFFYKMWMKDSDIITDLMVQLVERAFDWNSTRFTLANVALDPPP